MPLQQMILQVFVASPSDVTDELGVLSDVIDELNNTWADTLGVSFRLYRWNSCATPGFGTEPQAVINSQIPPEFDVFIGIFWGRIGSPTKGYPSGTVEEFERAFARHQSCGTPEIILYFKDAPLPPSKIEPDQLAQLHAFRESVGKRGGLYSTFEDQDGFEASLRSHLSAAARKYSELGAGAVAKPTRTKDVQAPEDVSLEPDPDDLGYIDYIEIFSTETQKMTSCLEAVGALTAEIGRKFRKRTEQITGSQGNPARAKSFMLMSASDMSQYARDLDCQTDIYKRSKSTSFEALSKAVSLHIEIAGKDEGLLGLQATLRNIQMTIADSRVSVLGLRDAASNLPRMIREINQSKRQLVDALDGFLTEIDSTIATASNIADSIDRII